MVLAVAFGASAKFRWGPVVGANFPYYYWEQNLVESTTLAGFSAGVQCELYDSRHRFRCRFRPKVCESRR